MRRARPKQHTRVIKTKRGRKRITINKGVKKHKTSTRKRSFLEPNKYKKEDIEDLFFEQIHALNKKATRKRAIKKAKRKSGFFGRKKPRSFDPDTLMLRGQSISEIERRIKQQEEINIVKEKQRTKELEREIKRRLEPPQIPQSELRGTEQSMIELGKEMLELPETKTVTDITSAAPSFEQEEQIMKKRIREIESNEAEIIRQHEEMRLLERKAKKTKYQERRDVLRFAEKAKREAEKEYNISIRQRLQMQKKLKRLKTEAGE